MADSPTFLFHDNVFSGQIPWGNDIIISSQVLPWQNKAFLFLFFKYNIFQQVCFFAFLMFWSRERRGKKDNTSNPNHSLSKPGLTWLHYGSNFCTCRFAYDCASIEINTGIFVLGKCVQTGTKTIVVDRGNHKPLALLHLTLGLPLNATNSSDKLQGRSCLLNSISFRFTVQFWLCQLFALIAIITQR